MPPKDTQLSELTSAPTVSDYGLITSKASRQAAGVPHLYDDMTYVDAWNQAKMAQYNNDYNYWLWRQQAEYNSPSNQVARLKAAGLNPNFNSIDGTGNLGSMPTSSSSMTPSVGRNRSLGIQSVLGEVNAIIGAVSSGVENLSRLSDLPPLALMGQYREALFKTARSQMREQQYKEFRELVGSLTDSIFAGGQLPDDLILNTPFMANEEGTLHFKPSDAVNYKTADQRLKNLGYDGGIKQLIRDFKQYMKDNEVWKAEADVTKGRAGMAALGDIINKISSGEHVSWRDIVAAIIAVGASKF